MRNFNNKLAQKITDAVSTMLMAYLFAIIGIMGVVGALTDNVKIVLIVGAVSGYFLQLVLLPIIMVGQKIQSDSVKDHVNIKHEELKAHVGKLTKGKK